MGDGDSPPERKPPRGLASRDAQTPARRYSLYVGLAFVVVAVIAAINTISTQEGGLLGTDPAQRGEPLAPFSVPDALGPLVGDANVFQDDCETSRNPCPAADRRTPACEVPGEDVIRVCDLFDRPLALSFWFTRGGDCLPTQDLFDELAGRYGERVSFLSVNVRDDRDEVRRIVRERGWKVPVGHDADGAVSNLYRVGVCPTIAFAYPGGILAGAAVGSEELGEDELERRIERLLRESRAREAASR
jgi:thiol-disulfide isomerase/thioredoxin